MSHLITPNSTTDIDDDDWYFIQFGATERLLRRQYWMGVVACVVLLIAWLYLVLVALHLNWTVFVATCLLGGAVAYVALKVAALHSAYLPFKERLEFIHEVFAFFDKLAGRKNMIIQFEHVCYRIDLEFKMNGEPTYVVKLFCLEDQHEDYLLRPHVFKLTPTSIGATTGTPSMWDLFPDLELTAGGTNDHEAFCDANDRLAASFKLIDVLGLAHVRVESGGMHEG